MSAMPLLMNINDKERLQEKKKKKALNSKMMSVLIFVSKVVIKSCCTSCLQSLTVPVVCLCTEHTLFLSDSHTVSVSHRSSPHDGGK